MELTNVSKGGALTDGRLGFDEGTIERAAMAIAWGELGLKLRLQSFWGYFDADRDRFRREARQLLTMMAMATATTAVASSPTLHGMALAITHGVSREETGERWG